MHLEAELSFPSRAADVPKPTAESCLIPDFQSLDHRPKAQGHSNKLQSDLAQIFFNYAKKLLQRLCKKSSTSEQHRKIILTLCASWSVSQQATISDKTWLEGESLSSGPKASKRRKKMGHPTFRKTRHQQTDCTQLPRHKGALASLVFVKKLVMV